MTTLQSLVRSRSDLPDPAADRLVALVADWSILADLGFSDLVLYVPTWNAGGMVAVAQVRPDTVPTRIPGDLVGRFVPRGRLPQVDRAWASGQISRSRSEQRPYVPVDREAIPVRMPPSGGGITSHPVAVIARYAGVTDRPLGQLEDIYLRAADDLADQITGGRFPDSAGDGSGLTRVGDGLMRLDAHGAVTFASPNAQSAMGALGLATPLVGSHLARILGRLSGRGGAVDQDVAHVARGREPGAIEVDSTRGTLALRSIPLGTEERAGALVLVRDVTELRRSERALLTKDATIREIHHRVKNNLQTVAALLRLQARRMPSQEASDALLDAVQRVTTIAMVHETMSLERGDDVDFDSVADRLVEMAADAAGAHAAEQGSARVVREGSFGVLPATLATPLAMCLSELLLNAAEHSGAHHIELGASRSGRELRAWVSDDGQGMAGQGEENATSGLGLQIVRALAGDQLAGHLQWDDTARGTRIVIDTRIP